MLKCPLHTCTSWLWEPTWPVCCMFSTSLPFKWWQAIRRTGQSDPTVPGTSLWLRWQGRSPGGSDEASSQQADHLLLFTSPWNFKRERSWESADRLGNDSVAGEWGALGSWCVEAEQWGRKIKSGLESLLKSGHKTALENCKGMERVQLCTCSCYWDTHLWQRQLCHFCCFPESYSSDFEWHPISPKSLLQQFPLQRAHGQVQSSRESGETPWGSDAQNATAEVETAPKGEWRGARRKQRPSPDLCKPRGAFSINFLKSRLWQGRWRTQTCETGLKISYLHYFPNCTVFNYFLLVTLGWQVYFVLWFSWDDLIA